MTLLFAIYRINLALFCISDEADASLDNASLFIKNNYFIIIHGLFVRIRLM